MFRPVIRGAADILVQVRCNSPVRERDKVFDQKIDEGIMRSMEATQQFRFAAVLVCSKRCVYLGGMPVWPLMFRW